MASNTLSTRSAPTAADDDKKEKLRKAILGALRKADELGVKSVAFPAISAGIYGCPST